MAAKKKTVKAVKPKAKRSGRAKKPAVKTPDYNMEFEKLSKEYEKFLYKSFPTYGTTMGLPEYDALLSNPTPAFFARYEKKLKDFLAKVKAIPASKLDLDNKVDRAIAINLLMIEIKEMKDRPGWKRSASMYFQEPMYGVYVILTRAGDDLPKRADGIIARTAGLPAHLALGKKNLKNPPKLFVESAILSARGAKMFFDTTVRKFADTLTTGKKKKLAAACNKAVKAMDDYINWMETDLMPRAKGEWRSGKARFNYRLKTYHEVPYDADSLYELGKKTYASTIRQMQRLAKKIDPKKSWEEIVSGLKKKHPTNKELVGYYAKEMKRARKFVKEHDLVSFPPTEEIKVVATPDFARPIIPYAAYLMPGLYEKKQTGIFWVTTVAKGTPKKQADVQLEGHSKYGIVVTSLHEAYPGHHLQLTRANMKPRIWRHTHHTSVFAEGWALYCEEMMFEKGFYSDPRIRLLQLKDQLWRATRVMIDVSLHTRGMTFDEAVKMLIEKAHLEEPNAIAEVRRYCQTPTQPMSYVLGKHLVLELKKKMKAKTGRKFDLKAFHDAFIDHGTIPVSRVEQLMDIG